MKKIHVSLVSTILNDKSAVDLMMDDLLNQTKLIDEFVVVDGGSTDGTYELLKSWVDKVSFNLVLKKEDGVNVAKGRNMAIEIASHSVILSTDFGCRLDSRWVEELSKPFEEDSNVDAVFGSWQVIEEELSYPAQWAELALAGGTLGMVATSSSLASNRSIALKKEIWNKLGKFPEDLTLAADDAMFSYCMLNSGIKIEAAPNAMCYWHRFPKIKSYFKESRRNFRGAGEALIFRKSFVKTAILLFCETLTLLLVIFTTALLILDIESQIMPWIIYILFGMVWSKSIYKWGKAIKLLKSKGKLFYWKYIPILDIGVRYNLVLGFIEGYFKGNRNCKLTRSRLSFYGVES